MKITICANMTFIKEMVEVEKILKSKGHEVFLPELKDFHEIRDVEGDLEKFLKYKKEAIKEHFEKIRKSDAIFVLNYEKNGEKDHIGGNTFLEIGLAFHYKKKIFLLNPIPENIEYTEEIQAIDPIILNGNLEMIK